MVSKKTLKEKVSIECNIPSTMAEHSGSVASCNSCPLISLRAAAKKRRCSAMSQPQHGQQIMLSQRTLFEFLVTSRAKL